ncbi:hypothetical protein [Variovorax saccharolyticus]|uniref:hypothetical protein n=1 Tax=Variovorax saccharolyticus TaxID=3053516 RepID=UPI002574BB1B|nr:hypothetical protein [Variovorax sp. J31P216]MDM0030408.1 hypothetical protein [Variovorax sp. J31P216]
MLNEIGGRARAVLPLEASQNAQGITEPAGEGYHEEAASHEDRQPTPSVIEYYLFKSFVPKMSPARVCDRSELFFDQSKPLPSVHRYSRTLNRASLEHSASVQRSLELATTPKAIEKLAHKVKRLRADLEEVKRREPDREPLTLSDSEDVSDGADEFGLRLHDSRLAELMLSGADAAVHEQKGGLLTSIVNDYPRGGLALKALYFPVKKHLEGKFSKIESWEIDDSVLARGGDKFRAALVDAKITDSGKKKIVLDFARSYLPTTFWECGCDGEMELLFQALVRYKIEPEAVKELLYEQIDGNTDSGITYLAQCHAARNDEGIRTFCRAITRLRLVEDRKLIHDLLLTDVRHWSDDGVAENLCLADRLHDELKCNETLLKFFAEADINPGLYAACWKPRDKEFKSYSALANRFAYLTDATPVFSLQKQLLAQGPDGVSGIFHCLETGNPLGINILKSLASSLNKEMVAKVGRNDFWKTLMQAMSPSGVSGLSRAFESDNRDVIGAYMNLLRQLWLAEALSVPDVVELLAGRQPSAVMSAIIRRGNASLAVAAFKEQLKQFSPPVIDAVLKELMRADSSGLTPSLNRLPLEARVDGVSVRIAEIFNFDMLGKRSYEESMDLPGGI